MWTSQVEVPSNVDTAHIGRYLATLEGTSGTLQVCRYCRTLTQVVKKFRKKAVKSTIFELEKSFKYIFGVAENL